MIKQLLKRFKFRMMASQLRKPGIGGGMKTGRMMNKANEFLYNKTISLLTVVDSSRILEIGFGNGMFFSKFFELSPHIQMTGIDYSPLMVKCASKINKEYIKNGRLIIYQGESNRLAFPDNTFDIVFCINVIYFWKNPEQHLKEVLRVMKPSGIFYSIFRTAESMQLMPFTRYGFKSYSTDEWNRLLQTCGFKPVSHSLINEPDAAFKGKNLQIESLFFKAIKPAYK